MWAELVIWKPCKRCHRRNHVDETCSYCGGYGLVGHDSPHTCPECGGSGTDWPPRCQCGAYRAAHALYLVDQPD